MQNEKPLEFHGTAGGYFVVFLVSLVMSYIPFFGWAFMLNYVSEWFADNSLVNGKKVAYKAGYGESLKFVFVNVLLLVVTLGIYMFWFYPKLYRYVVDHVSYASDTVPVAAAAPAAEQTVPESSEQSQASEVKSDDNQPGA